MAENADDRLILHSRRCCVQIVGRTSGCGFFVAPGLVVTCAHVVGKDSVGDVVEVVWDKEIDRGATVLAVLPSGEEDLALLRVTFKQHPCVRLGSRVRAGDPLCLTGFPNYGRGVMQDTVLAEFESYTQVRKGDRSHDFLKFKNGQVVPGFSGGPLLNLRVGAVIGIVTETRGRTGSLGGWAIPTKLAVERFSDMAEAHDSFHQSNFEWEDASHRQRFEDHLTNGGVMPELLPDLCDREQQLACLTTFFEGVSYGELRRPMIVIIHGNSSQAHASFLERVSHDFIPTNLEVKRLGLDQNYREVRPTNRLTSTTVAALTDEIPRVLSTGLQYHRRCHNEQELHECFRAQDARLIIPIFDFNSREGLMAETNLVNGLVDYWSTFPDLPPALAVMVVVCVKYVDSDSKGLLRRWFSSPSRNGSRELRVAIDFLQKTPSTSGSKLQVLPELQSAKVDHVEDWFLSPRVRPHISREHRLYYGRIKHEIFGGQTELPMEEVLYALREFISNITSS